MTGDKLPTVLHIWNLTGGSSLIAKYYGKLYGGRAEVIARRKFDRFRFTEFYGGTTYGDGALYFYIRAALKSRKFDIIQIHSLDRLVPPLRTIYGSKPIILQYHGHDILNRWKEKQNRWEVADFISYSTPDMASADMPERARYIKDMIDTDIFRPGNVERMPATAFTFSYNMDGEAHELAKKMGVALTIAKRFSIPMEEMANVFSKYEYFFDLRRRTGQPKPIECLGTAAFQAQACGCKAVDWKGDIHTGFPEGHDPASVMSIWMGIYGELSERG